MKLSVIRSLNNIWLLVVVLLPSVTEAQFVFTTNVDGTLTMAYYTGFGSDVVIPTMTNGLSVTCIGANAFASNGIVSSVTIPDSVSSIEYQAFMSCTNLTGANIGKNVANIGMGAFVFCSLLNNIAIPESVTNIGIGAFDDCRSMTMFSIPNKVTSIGQGAFAGCTSLTNVTIGKSVMIIGANAFQLCNSLNTITIPSSVTGIGSYAFASVNLTSVYFQGNAPTPSSDSTIFGYSYYATIYYLPGATGWGPTFGGRPTVLWNPQAQTKDGSFGLKNNQFGFNITGSSNLVIEVVACTNLANPTWVPVSTNTLNIFVGTNGTSYFSDPQWTNYPNRFYRFRSP